jgi:hypothetical protein
VRKRRVVILSLSAVVLAGVGLVVAGALSTSRPRAAPLPTGTPAAAVTQPTVSGFGSPSAGPLPLADAPTHSPTPEHQQALAPSSIGIPVLGVTATIGAAPVINGVLTPPRIPNEVGAWSGSASLNSTTGEITLAGHVNWTGMAPFAFARLAYLHPGDLVYTSDTSGRQTVWAVATVTARPKSAGVDPAAFAGLHGPRTLVLITCGGPFDQKDSSYDDNIYVTAHPQPA